MTQIAERPTASQEIPTPAVTEIKKRQQANEARQISLETDILGLLERLNISDRRSLVVPGEYLEVVISKR